MHVYECADAKEEEVTSWRHCRRRWCAIGKYLCVCVCVWGSACGVCKENKDGLGRTDEFSLLERERERE
jgi:hypothetical protein